MTFIQSIIFTAILFQIYFENYILGLVILITSVFCLQHIKVRKAHKMIPNHINFKFGFKEYDFSKSELLNMMKEQKVFLEEHKLLKLGISDVIYKSCIERDAEYDLDEKNAVFKSLVNQKIEPNKTFNSNINFIDSTYEVLKRNINNTFLDVDCRVLLKELSYFDFSKKEILINEPRDNRLIEKDKEHLIYVVEECFNSVCHNYVFHEGSAEFNERFEVFKKYLKVQVRDFKDLRNLINEKYVFEYDEYDNLSQYIDLDKFKKENSEYISKGYLNYLFK